MKNYLVMVYGAPAETEAERSMGMQLMADWYRALGPALVNPGAPFVGVRGVTARGVEEKTIGPNASGYAMIQADSLDGAAELARGCPLLEHGREINVFETFAM